MDAEDYKPLLLRVDLCDAKGCGARAFHAAIFASRSELLFCNHHARQYHDALERLAICVIDYRDELNHK